VLAVSLGVWKFQFAGCALTSNDVVQIENGTGISAGWEIITGGLPGLVFSPEMIVTPQRRRGGGLPNGASSP